jgi:maltose alpha-D-glucosyltransferase/alpha-amylase
MSFHFPLMPRMFMAVHLEDRFPIVDILRQTPEIPSSCQWATFLRNHDELTLEMVTDEDRDYMYRVYAQDPTARINLGIRRRLAPLVKGRRRIELMNGILMSLPGTPVLYYGDEIGMGDNIYLGDRDGVRTPMQWSADRNAGFSIANPQKLYLPVITDPEYHYEANNVQAQQSNATSLLWWMKRLIALRKENPVFGGGAIEFLQPENHKVLAFVRSDGRRRVLVLANLSRFSQGVELDLSAYHGLTPVEMFGRSPFPVIGDQPYFLSIGPHGFYWFTLEERDGGRAAGRSGDLEQLEVTGSWTKVLQGKAAESLERVLLDYVPTRRWFRSKARACKRAAIEEVIGFDTRDASRLVLVRIEFMEGDPEVYVLPLSWRSDAEAADLPAVARLRVSDAAGTAVDGLLVDGLAVDVPAHLTDAIRRRATLNGRTGQMQAFALRPWKEVARDHPLTPRVADYEQSNSAVLLGDRMLLKVYRQLEYGPNPELELGEFLNQRSHARIAPRMLAWVQYRHFNHAETATLATVQELIANEGVAWQSTLASLERYFERVLAEGSAAVPPFPSGSSVEQSRVEPPPEMQALLGTYVPRVRLLARRIAELHQKLASEPELPAFAPQSFTGFYQQSLYQSAHRLLSRTVQQLRKGERQLSGPEAELARGVIADEPAIDARLRLVTGRRIDVQRIRVHGDLHLGQVLDTGDDFVVIDFEGEPGRPLNERRYKRSALLDVAGMMRSLHYASESALRSGRIRPEDVAPLKPWAHAWTAWVRAAFLCEYLAAVGKCIFVPAADEDKDLLLDFYQLEKCIYEIRYELNNRPAWLAVPIEGLRERMGQT